MASWLTIPRGSHFGLANIPFGIISHAGGLQPRPAIAIADMALDLQLFTAQNGFRDLSTIQPHSKVFSEPTLNAFAALGRPIHSVVRKYLQSVFLASTPYPEVLKDNKAARNACMIPIKDVNMHLPMRITDYTDFYAGMNHAYNCGVMFRGPENALQPNYKHLPVGYHGRASSVVVSGTPIRRPRGQILEDPTAQVKKPIFAPCRKLDMELELAAFVCKPSTMGEPIKINDANEHLFGLVLMNDWSARDIQAWEYVPLGPFTSKSFGTTVSPWVVLMDALEPFRTAGLPNDVELLDHLQEAEKHNVYSVNLQVDLSTKSGSHKTISKVNAKNLLFSFPQMLTHHTATGCPFSVGDLLGSGTISGTDSSSMGSLLEQSQNGKVAIQLDGGDERHFLADHDQVIITGCCGDGDNAVGFGTCEGVIMPAITS